jgi:hypothetical protein
MRATRWKLAVGLFGLIWGQCASAVTIGGFTFDDNAFADSLTGSTGAVTTVPTTGLSLDSVMTDIDENTGAFPTGALASFQLAFTDNTVVNGVDEDLVLFELGPAPSGGGPINSASVSIETSTGIETRSYDFLATTTTDLNAAAIDLSDFGIGVGESVSSVLVITGELNSDLAPATLTLVGALNNGVTPIPVPAAVWMFGTGLIGLVGVARRRNA